MAKKNKKRVISSVKNSKGSDYMDEILIDDNKIINDEADYGRSPYSKTRDFTIRMFPHGDW